MTRLRRVDVASAIFLGALALYHLALQDRGAMAWGDEYLYRDALGAVAALSQLDLQGFCRELTGFGARPGEATLRLVPAAIQWLLEAGAGLSRFDPMSLRIAVLPNVVISLLLSIAFYRLALRLLDQHRPLALLATGIFSLLVNSNVWIRHVVPYDTALALWLVTLERALRIPTGSSSVRWRPCLWALVLAATGLVLYPAGFLLSRAAGLPAAVVGLACLVAALHLTLKGADPEWGRWCRTTGVLSGCALVVYPAFYSFAAVVALVILVSGRPGSLVSISGARSIAALVFGLGVLVVMFVYEVVARVGGVSYLASALRLSGTIKQGSFEEGYVFVIRYLLQVEWLIGAAIVLLGAVYAVTMVWRWRRGEAMSPARVHLDRCLIVFGCLYLVYATQSTVLHKMTFTGRYLRMYLPVLVIVAVAVIGDVRSARWRRLACGIIASLSLVSFGWFVVDYSRAAYPNNVLHDLGIGFEDVVPENRVYESAIIPDYGLPLKRMTAGANYVTRPGDRRFVLVNFGWFDLEGAGFAPYVPPAGARLVYRGRHFLTWRSSRFEAYGAARRRELVERGYDLRVYQVPES